MKMDKIIHLGVILLICTRDIWSIPLPGVKVHEQQQDVDSSFFPFPELDFGGNTPVESSYRDIIPGFNQTVFQNEATTTTTESPLAMMLDKLYGNSNWRNQFGQSVGDMPVSTTSFPLQPQPAETSGETLTAGQGFYGNEMSGNQFLEILGLQGAVHNQGNTQSKPSSSKYMMKIVGTRQYSTNDLPNGQSETSGGGRQQWENQAPMGSDGGSVSSMSMKPLPMSMTQTPVDSIGGLGVFDPNQANSLDGDLPHYTNSITNNYNPPYDPAQANNDHEYFHQISTFNNFITQTGSDPSNQQLPVNYNADKVNERTTGITDNTGQLHQGITGFTAESMYGKEQIGYRFSAYSDTKPQAFDANALNQALLGRNMLQQQQHQQQQSSQQQHMSPMFLAGSQVQQPTRQTQRNVTNTAPTVNGDGIKKADTILAVEHLSQTSPRPPQRFNFVPGNLFPGQSQQTVGQQIVGVAREASPPQFLRHLPISVGGSSFNPTLVNAAQSLYNPNAQSWIRTARDLSSMLQQLNQEDVAIDSEDNIDNSSAYPVTTTPASVSSIDASLGVTTIKNIGTTVSFVTKETTVGHNDISGDVSGTAFNPNVLNANQGQGEFIPGQISPSFYGYMNNNHNQNSGESQVGLSNAFKPGNSDNAVDGGAKMTFNIAQLLGLNTNGGDKNTTGYGFNPTAFNPNIVNNIKIGSNNKTKNNSSGNTDASGKGYFGAGFDPNAANQGFGNLLGGTNDNQSVGFMSGFGGGFDPNSASQGFANMLGGYNNNNQSVGFMGGNGGFDPNAANVGFGSGGFGLGGTGAGGGAANMATFDPNKVNQMAIHNPYEQGNNGTGNASMLGYFLGMSMGKGQGQNGMTSYISAFNPDTVNHAPYDPNKFNKIQLHFDPIDMLATNPGIDKGTLVAAASAFDPDKLNKPNMQQAFSPIAMLSGNHIMNNPIAGSGVSSHKTNSTSGSLQTSKQSQHPSSNVFDPIAVMIKLMQSSAAFQPGSPGTGQQNLDPLGMFERNHVSPSQSTQTTVRPTTVAGKSTVATQSKTSSTMQPTSTAASSTSPTSTSTSATSTQGNNLTIG